jgi:hypothetical protein
MGGAGGRFLGRGYLKNTRYCNITKDLFLEPRNRFRPPTIPWVRWHTSSPLESTSTETRISSVRQRPTHQIGNFRRIGTSPSDSMRCHDSARRFVANRCRLRCPVARASTTQRSGCARPKTLQPLELAKFATICLIISKKRLLRGYFVAELNV